MSDSYKLEYTNIRCAKCGNIISLHKPIDLTKTAYEEMQMGFIIRARNNHNCPEGIQDDEAVIAKAISFSNSPLENAYEVYEPNEERRLVKNG